MRFIARLQVQFYFSLAEVDVCTDSVVLHGQHVHSKTCQDVEQVAQGTGAVEQGHCRAQIAT